MQTVTAGHVRVTMALPSVLELPKSLRSPGRARRFVRDELGGRLSPEQLDHAVLLVSELVTNAVLHAGTPCTVELRDSGAVVQLRVSDGGTALPARRRTPSDAASNGRGLHLLEHVTLRWGVEEVRHGGKVVWAELPCS